MLDIFARYPTFLIFAGLLISLVLTLILMPLWIRVLKIRQIGQQIRADGPERHLSKQGTPTMGGVVILIVIVISIIFTTRFSLEVLCILAVLILTGLIGFVDDITKVVQKRSLGLKPYQKLIFQFSISIAFCLIAVNFLGIDPLVKIPFINISLDFGILTTTLPIGDNGFIIPWLYIILIMFIMVGFSNAVNLTDGLDGLAGGTVMLVMLAMGAIAFADNQLDVAIVCCTAAGSCIGFIWYNCYPAKIFMGDTGSLALGAMFAAVCVITKSELFSVIIGFLFVAEALSVILQVIYFKYTKKKYGSGKRIFLMTPIHHHFEKKGWSETTVVIRFWILCAIFAAIGFAAYFSF
ncbi:MAG: phospho-N-acetylmuramoyl-pentapeptide-transferase [Coriobacteriales bacterium]|nr:phospho-N-acetylmuramoyl-pentapeptide-transferase [Coriobacteriales bacterium]